MVTNRKATGRAMTMPGGLIAGGVVSLISTLVVAAVLSKLLDSGMMEWEDAGYGILVLLLVSSALGAVTACSKIKRQWLAVSLLSGMVYFGVLMAITALFFGGQYEAVGVTAVLVFGASVSVGLMKIRGGRGRGGKRKIKQHR